MQCVQLTNADNVELKAALQELLLDLGSDAVETDVALGEDALRRLRLGCSDVGHVGGSSRCGGRGCLGGFGSAFTAWSLTAGG